MRPVFVCARLEGSADGLLALDRLEQGFEVALAEAGRTLAVDDFVDPGRPVSHRLAEDLEQIAKRMRNKYEGPSS